MHAQTHHHHRRPRYHHREHTGIPGWKRRRFHEVLPACSIPIQQDRVGYRVHREK